MTRGAVRRGTRVTERFGVTMNKNQHALTVNGMTVDELIAYHRSVFGAAVMSAEPAGVGGSGDDGADARNGGGEPDAANGESSDDGLGDGGKRALAAERAKAREKAREAAAEKTRADELAARVQQLEREQMSEAERVIAERDDLKKKLEERERAYTGLELEVTRRDVATEKGIPQSMARRLQGNTREEIEADADLMLRDMPQPQVSPYPPNTPRPDPSQGSSAAKAGGRPTSVADAMADYRARDKRQTT